ncbi:MAG: hypothetical protein ACRD4X_17730 [Candidatus Acidiferrales bacterium]
MRRLIFAVLLFAFSTAAQRGPMQAAPRDAAVASGNSAQSDVLLGPAGTMVPLALVRPVLAKSAAVGEAVYAETAFPVVVGGRLAIPAGTYVRGEIDSITRPGVFSPHAQFEIHFTQLIFANGYTFEFSSMQSVAGASQPTSAVASPASANDVIPAVALVYVDVTRGNDVLLDNGTQFEMVLQEPVQLISASVASAARAAKPLDPRQFRTASVCRPTPGSPGTPDTVIPGTPDTVIPGTPDTVIPGTPDTVIPGTPDTVIPGTPDTVMPGSPATPDIPCPGPPVVAGSTKARKQSFALGAPAQLAGQQLASGSYEAAWKGSGPLALVQILHNNKVVASIQARVVLLDRKSPAPAAGMVTNPDGSRSLQSLRFAGQSFALYFDLPSQRESS